MNEARPYRQVRFEHPAGAAHLVLVRHGESEPAQPGRPFPLVAGHGDPQLAPLGHRQAERVAERLAGEPIDAIYVTTLRRTAQTAEPLARQLGLHPQVEAELREVHLGEWEGGLYRQRVIEGDPLALRMLAEQRWDVIPGAEPSDAFAERVQGAIARVAARHPDQQVAVFTHGGVIGQTLSLATGASRFAFAGADNGSISRLVVDPRRWVVRSYNDVAHLETADLVSPQATPGNADRG
ncbi:MAG TPA: histidine phosphatase family protein [Acidimicrobiales bacterium]|nr:histidine phosphatase family protein [Acidimicrobiales bacterium]